MYALRTAVSLLLVTRLVAAGVAPACPKYTPVPNPPASLYCGETGTLDPTQVSKLSVSKGVTQKACIASCEGNDRCISFGFKSAGGVCTGYRKALNQQGFKQSSSGPVIYWNRQCFKCQRQVITSTTTKVAPTSSTSAAPPPAQCTAYNLKAIGGSETAVLGKTVASGDETDGGATYYSYFESNYATKYRFDPTSGYLYDYNNPGQVLSVILSLPSCGGSPCLVGNNMFLSFGRLNDTATALPATCAIDSSTQAVTCTASYGGYTWSNLDAEVSNCPGCYDLGITTGASTVDITAVTIVFNC